MPKGVWRRNMTDGLTSNALVPDSLSDLGGGACFNDARVQIERVEASGPAPAASLDGHGQRKGDPGIGRQMVDASGTGVDG